MWADDRTRRNPRDFLKNDFPVGVERAALHHVMQNDQLSCDFVVRMVKIQIFTELGRENSFFDQNPHFPISSLIELFRHFLTTFGENGCHSASGRILLRSKPQDHHWFVQFCKLSHRTFTVRFLMASSVSH